MSSTAAGAVGTGGDRTRQKEKGRYLIASKRNEGRHEATSGETEQQARKRADRLGTDVRNTLIDVPMEPRVEKLSSKQASARSTILACREIDRAPSLPGRTHP